MLGVQFSVVLYDLEIQFDLPVTFVFGGHLKFKVEDFLGVKICF